MLQLLLFCMFSPECLGFAIDTCRGLWFAIGEYVGYFGRACLFNCRSRRSQVSTKVSVFFTST